MIATVRAIVPSNVPSIHRIAATTGLVPSGSGNDAAVDPNPPITTNLGAGSFKRGHLLSQRGGGPASIFRAAYNLIQNVPKNHRKAKP